MAALKHKPRLLFLDFFWSEIAPWLPFFSNEILIPTEEEKVSSTTMYVLGIATKLGESKSIL